MTWLDALHEALEIAKRAVVFVLAAIGGLVVGAALLTSCMGGVP